MLTREQILRALERVAALLREREITGEMCLLGGTVMMLAFKAREATKDVDAVFEPAAAVRDAAANVEREQDLPPGWLNDAAKGFLSSAHEATALAIVAQYDPAERVPARAGYLLEELFAEPGTAP